MSDEDVKRDDEVQIPGADEAELEGVDALDEAGLAEAEEAAAAADELYGAEEDLLADEDAELQIQEAVAHAHHSGLLARAGWSLVHKELLLLLFANCLFFVGVLAVWTRAAPGEAIDKATYINGLDTIRGSVIFVLALYGFFVLALNIVYRQLMVWPFLLNAIFALWVGIPGFTKTIGSQRWDQANAHLEKMTSKSMLDSFLVPLSSIPPAYWLLTLGGVMVLIVLVKGVLGGASAAKAASREGGGSRRRRR